MGEGGTGVILYLEDSLANLQLVEGIVAQRPGIRLISAMQGGVALELARQHHPDLILLDVHLPDSSGDMVMRQLALDPQTATIPVVAVSADATVARMAQLRRAGVREYLTKPIRIAELLAVLDRYLPALLVVDASNVPEPRPMAMKVLSSSMDTAADQPSLFAVEP